MVGVALGVLDKPRVEWDAVDLRYNGHQIEVKSSAYCQSWIQEKPSAIKFSIRKAVLWNPEAGAYEGEAVRSAGLYVFCLYPEKEILKANALDVAAWEFFVVSTKVLNRELPDSKSISLAGLNRLAEPCKFAALKAAVDVSLK